MADDAREAFGAGLASDSMGAHRAAPAGPRTWDLFRDELRRRWDRRGIRAALLAVLTLVLAQVGLVWALTRAGGGYPWESLPHRLAQSLGLLPPYELTRMLSPSLIPVPAGFRTLLIPPLNLHPLFIALAAVNDALRVLLPGYAGASVALVRKRRQVGSLLAAGHRPRGVLLAVGSACLMPLLGVLITYLALRPILPANPDLLGWASAPLSISHWLLDAGLMVCISALNTRVFRAIAWCYAAKLVAQPLVTQGAGMLMFWSGVSSQTLQPWQWLMPSVVLLGVQGMIVTVLYRQAVRALESDREPGSRDG